MRAHIRHSANFQLNQIFDQKHIPPQSTFNDFSHFIYKDHVTRIKYNVEQLKTIRPTFIQANQTSSSFLKTHKSSKSSIIPGKRVTSRFKSQNCDDIDFKKKELLHFLEDLEMMNKIRKNRNIIVSGVERAQKRKSMLFPTLNHQQSLESSKVKLHDIDTIKQQIRRQVSDLNRELFRDYMEHSEPYREVFNQLSVASSKGALNTSKIKQIKRKIVECTRIKQENKKKITNMFRRRQLDSKQNARYEKYFSSVAKQIDEQIHYKVAHEASFIWKYGGKDGGLDEIGKDDDNDAEEQDEELLREINE